MMITNANNAGEVIEAAAAAAAAATSPTSSSLIPATLAQNVQVVGAAWVISSTIFTTYSTTKFLKYSYGGKKLQQKQGSSSNNNGILSKIPRPTLLTLLRFSGSLFFGIMIHPDLHIVERIKETYDLAPPFVFPSLFLFVANYMNSVSLNRIGISLTYTSKCAIPLFTLVLSILLDGIGSLPRPKVLLTLVPIAAGIATASWNHPTFEKIGFAAALISCISQSALNVTCKKIMTKKGIAGPLALRVMVALGLVISSALSIVQFYTSSHTTTTNTRGAGGESDDDNAVIQQQQQQPPAWLGLMAALAYHLEYALSFTFVKLVAPITYAACDAVRRLGIIISGHYMFGGPPFTKLNILGIALALGGALSYSILNH